MKEAPSHTTPPPESRRARVLRSVPTGPTRFERAYIEGTEDGLIPGPLGAKSKFPTPVTPLENISGVYRTADRKADAEEEGEELDIADIQDVHDEKEVIPLDNIQERPVSHQLRRALEKNAERRTGKPKKAFTIENDQPTVVQAKYRAVPSSAIQKMMGQMDRIEGEIAAIHAKHDKFENEKHRSEAELRKELEEIRSSLTLETAQDFSPTYNNSLELPDLDTLDTADGPSISWGEAEIDNLDAEDTGIKRTKKRAEQKTSAEGRAVLENLAHRHGIVLSQDARAQRTSALTADIASKETEQLRLKELLKDDRETLANTHDITTDNRRSLEDRISETKATLAALPRDLKELKDERETYQDYPTAHAEIEFNLEEVVEEMQRTNPKNLIRLRQLWNNFADFKQMHDLLEKFEPVRQPKKGQSSTWDTAFGKTAQSLAKKFGISLDAGEETAKSEINARIQDLQASRDNGFNDRRLIDQRIQELAQLRTLLPPSKTEIATPSEMDEIPVEHGEMEDRRQKKRERQNTSRTTHVRDIPGIPEEQVRELLEDGPIINKYREQQAQERADQARNAKAYEKRAAGYQKDLAAVDEQLADYKKAKSTWYGSFLNATLNRGEIKKLEGKRALLLERIEEAKGLKNAVERDLPVFKRANITRQQAGRSEEPGKVDQRQREQLFFNEKLGQLEKTEELARDATDALVLNKNLNERPLSQQDREKITGLLAKKMMEYRNANQAFNEATLERRNAIPIILLQKVATENAFSQRSAIDDETREGIESIKIGVRRALQVLEAKAAVAESKTERADAQKRLDILKNLLGGTTAEETAQRAAFMLEAAERVAFMELDDTDVHQDLALTYASRIKLLQMGLQAGGKDNELLTTLNRELAGVIQGKS